MGRYYSGDIEGKFWFGVQSSDDAEFFGAIQLDSNYINYQLDEDNLPEIKEGITKCRVALGDKKEKLDAFFAEGGAGYAGYNDKMLAEYLGMPWDDSQSAFASINHPVHEMLEWYARLELGEKILKCVEEKGYCEFQAEI